MINFLTSKKVLALLSLVVIILLVRPIILGKDEPQNIDTVLMGRFQYEGALFKMRERMASLVCVFLFHLGEAALFGYFECVHWCVGACMRRALQNYVSPSTYKHENSFCACMVWSPVFMAMQICATY